ncbi:MAG: hypothetical protein A3F43_03105 [Gammaproteobacteria bacterium RIFCSPHIGHO2_12_FULL_42_10]|nr:MAG: hypothetical protein A3F43_03105 [Gammaproteobacteria bacterium RIFCSPHIGHO2_12_FULL_42_10]
MTFNNLAFKKIIILFWTLWWLIALWTDVVGGLAHLGILKASWAPDTNYPFLVETLKMYPVASWMPTAFFIAILAWSFLSTLAFCWASAGLVKQRDVWMRRAQVAFVISITFWLAFFIADQAVMKFDLEENHMVQGGFQLLTFLSLYLFPD